MELTYHDIMNARFSALTETAKNWRAMAKRCGTLRDNYRDHVRKKLTGWAGESATAFWTSSDITLHELSAAKRQATRIAELLDDAHGRLVEAREHLKKVRDQAIHEGGMKVDEYGKCNLDTSKMTDEEAQGALHDPSRMDTEAKWNRRIQEAVKHVDDVDYDNMLALKAAAKDTDGKGESGGFNSKAVGDVEKHAAQRSAELTGHLDSAKKGGGLSPAERRELQVMLRANSDDKRFTRTLLDSLGPEGLIEAGYQLNALGDRGDKGNRSQFQGIREDLATSLATATRVPTFRNEKGKVLDAGQAEYGDKYRAWLHSKDGAFYKDWREDMREAGVKEWSHTYGRAGTAPQTKVTGLGYPTLVTLMQHGEGYSPQMLHDLADDVRAAEEKDPHVWDRRGTDKEGASFLGGERTPVANDPYDGLLGIMAKDPDAAASYLNPASDPNPADGKPEKNDRLEYLVKDRDWKIINSPDAAVGPDTTNGDDKIDSDARNGFEAALKAGATGRLPDATASATPPDHSAANANVMEEAVRVFGGPPGKGEVSPIAKGEDFVGFRRTLAEMIADYPGDVQRETYGDNDLKVRGHAANFDAGALHEYLNQVGRDPYGYGVVKASQQMYTAEHLRHVLNNLPPEVDASDARDYAGDAVAGGAYVSGILSEAKADALYDEKIAKASDFNKNADEASKWVNRFVGLGTGNIGGGQGGGAMLAAPTGWAQEDLSAAVMEQIKKDVPTEAEKGESQGRYNFSETQERVRNFHNDLAESVGREAGLDREILDGVMDGVRIESIAGFQDGSGTSGSHGSTGPTE
ncbi:hypothetical protein ACTWQF_13480 [Streptomyces sp. 8N114]|uniref:hypothetical protein n=1 Tax=Streptomyces sp. 8N114 TaxID=3457419 RepID=UPI003FD15EC5